MNFEELKPCPFCGCPEIQMKWNYTNASEVFIEYSIKCKACLAKMSFERLARLPESTQFLEMIYQWNKRI